MKNVKMVSPKKIFPFIQRVDITSFLLIYKFQPLFLSLAISLASFHVFPTLFSSFPIIYTSTFLSHLSLRFPYSFHLAVITHSLEIASNRIEHSFRCPIHFNSDCVPKPLICSFLILSFFVTSFTRILLIYVLKIASFK